MHKTGIFEHILCGIFVSFLQYDALLDSNSQIARKKCIFVS